MIKAADEQIDKDVPGIDSEYRIGYDLTKELLKEHTDLTAIVGLNDMIAFGILDALYEEKYSSGRDVRDGMRQHIVCENASYCADNSRTFRDL